MSKRMVSLCASVFLFAGCEGGGDGVTRQPEPVDAVCDSTSVLVDGTCRAFAERIDARATTPLTENGKPVELEVVLFKPLEGERFPLLVVNHGSTGNGSDPSRFGETFIHKPTTRHFVEIERCLSTAPRFREGRCGSTRKTTPSTASATASRISMRSRRRAAWAPSRSFNAILV